MIAIVGSRNLNDYPWFISEVLGALKEWDVNPYHTPIINEKPQRDNALPNLHKRMLTEALQGSGPRTKKKAIMKIITGDARGADRFAYKWATEKKIPITVYKANWKAFGRAAGVMRNTDIVNECEYLIAFPSRKGKGTQDSIKKARDSGKKVKVIYID